MKMMLIDKKIFAGGIAILIVGIIIMVNLNASIPAGHSGMTEEEVIDLMVKQQENQDMRAFAGILIGVGFLLILISFGARRRKKDSPKKEEKKPTT
jgi:hypothetical protein